MNKNYLKILISLSIIALINSPIYSESLFRSSINENSYGVQPRPLFSSVKAKAIGDIVTININENINTSDAATYTNKDSSTLTDNFSSLWNKILPGNILPSSNLNGFGGGNTASKQSSNTRATVLTSTITAQVVQILPNGNLLVQGKKTSMNANEKLEIIVSGIIDPRLITQTGSIDSTLVANLQIAVNGKGSMSKTNYENPITKYVKYLY